MEKIITKIFLFKTYLVYIVDVIFPKSFHPCSWKQCRNYFASNFDHCSCLNFVCFFLRIMRCSVALEPKETWSHFSIRLWGIRVGKLGTAFFISASWLAPNVFRWGILKRKVGICDIKNWHLFVNQVKTNEITVTVIASCDLEGCVTGYTRTVSMSTKNWKSSMQYFFCAHQMI